MIEDIILVDNRPAETGRDRGKNSETKDFQPLDIYGDSVLGDRSHVMEFGLWELHKASEDQIKALIPTRYMGGVICKTKHFVDTLITMITWKYIPTFATMAMARFVQIIDRRLNPRDGWNALTDRKVGI